MIPYYFKINEEIFSEECKQYVVKNSLDNIDKFSAYAGVKSKMPDGNHFYYGPIINDYPEIKKIINSCTLSCYPIIMLHKPNSRVLKHVDDLVKRNCILVTPLHPLENYTPTLFWKKDNYGKWNSRDLELESTCDFSDMKSVFLNTQQVHSLETNDEYRINLQLCFNKSFETVVKIYQSGQLFINE